MCAGFRPPAEAREKPEMLYWGAPDRESLVAQAVAPVSCNGPSALDGPFTTGYIERDSFEEVTGGTMLEIPDHSATRKSAGSWCSTAIPKSTRPAIWYAGGALS